MIERIIQRHLFPADNYIYGFADMTGLLTDKFQGFNYGISIGLKLNNSIVNRIKNGPTIEYYDHYRQINAELSELTKKISVDLINNHIETINIEPSVSTAELDSIYSHTLTTDLSHKMVATRAGLGWIGKTDLFISKEAGPRLRLVSILVKYPVVSRSKPIDKSRCGTCNICVKICPAQAANGKLWDITVDRKEFFNPWKCREQCAEFGRLRLRSDARVCGMCVAVCPVGQTKPEEEI